MCLLYVVIRKARDELEWTLGVESPSKCLARVYNVLGVDYGLLYFPKATFDENTWKHTSNPVDE